MLYHYHEYNHLEKERCPTSYKVEHSVYMTKNPKTTTPQNKPRATTRIDFLSVGMYPFLTDDHK